ncbi:MAG TPA: tetracycline efflux MFS transporter Tet(40), partial [Anaerolineales bacterium]|nr:tetracycline efflux MFS transporter Tet(40) [Anaerolineales bacterium]
FVEALRLDPLQLVLLGTALEAAYFVTEIPTGVVADVYSRRLSILIGLALLGGSFVVAGLVGDFSLLIATQIGAGIGF